MTGFITCILNGGLGNQLFEIAHAFALSKKLNLPFVISFSSFLGLGQGSHPSKYAGSLYSKLDIVNKLLPVTVFVEEQTFSFDKRIEKELEKFVQNNRLVGISIRGYFQSEQYFLPYKEEVKKLFSPDIGIKNFLKIFYPALSEKFIELFSDSNVDERCYIGVRRGDYIKNANFHLPCGLDYYKEAIEEIGQDKIFYIATDDMDWCKANFKGGLDVFSNGQYIRTNQFKFFEVDDDLPQLLLATLFKYYIISNSTFHWWATYLSIYEDRQAIAPDKWLNVNGYESIYTDYMKVLKRS